jgi:hypothetical protein
MGHFFPVLDAELSTTDLKLRCDCKPLVYTYFMVIDIGPTDRSHLKKTLTAVLGLFAIAVGFILLLVFPSHKASDIFGGTANADAVGAGTGSGSGPEGAGAGGGGGGGGSN